MPRTTNEKGSFVCTDSSQSTRLFHERGKYTFKLSCQVIPEILRSSRIMDSEIHGREFVVGADGPRGAARAEEGWAVSLTEQHT
jgi:hypothetical protein